MNAQKISINKFFSFIGCIIIIIFLAMLVVLYVLTENNKVVLCGVLFIALFLLCFILLVVVIRQKLVLFSETICRTLDDMMEGEIEPTQIDAEEESLFYKINHRIARLYEIMLANRHSIAKEREELQELISDISHQVKTPIANLKMINTTLLEQPVPEEKRRDFLVAMDSQVDKLDFLMQAMIKTSRLETGVISLEKKKQPIYETLAAALGGILLNAEKKGIQVHVSCPEALAIYHDRKWTSEAFFNILDNAVKYTPAGGSIRVYVESWEMYLKISIADTGKGIPESRRGAIFKRFYREEEVHDIEGIGIGLYLAREIIIMQGGYIKVTSEIGKGSTFSVFLPNQ